ncbi:alpha-agarase-like [Artemia franciscana]
MYFIYNIGISFMKSIQKALYLLVVGIFLTGCAGTGKVSQPMCALAGAIVAGGGSAAVHDGDKPDRAFAVGALVGAAIGYIACSEGPALDSDGDGVIDDLDQCPGTPMGTPVGTDGCPLDSDGDGVNDDMDQCPGTPAGTTVGTDGCPLDSDGDGVIDDNDQCPGTPAGVEVEANGCPKVGETLMVLQGVHFAFDSAVLTDEAKYKLDEAATTLNGNSLVNVKVVGHTDSIGSESYNQGLSQKRAAAVVEYLSANGVSEYRLTSEGMGEVHPIADNTTDQGRYQNRRVEFIVVE